jgi:hypothetical protein
MFPGLTKVVDRVLAVNQQGDKGRGSESMRDRESVIGVSTTSARNKRRLSGQTLTE